MINWKGYTPDLIPLFWRYRDDSAHKVLVAAEGSLKDLFQDIETRYKALEIETCEDYKPELLRPMYLYMLADGDGSFPEAQWNKFKEYQRKFFKDRYFIYPEQTGADTVVWKSIQETTECAALYNGLTVTKDSGYFWVETPEGGNPSTIVFQGNPFDVFLGRWTETEVAAPWKRTYRCKRLVLWASNLNMSESVIETHYADFITGRGVVDMFRDDGALSAFVYNFYRTLYRGATQMSVAAFVNSLAGYDYIRSDYETVGTWGISYDPETGTELNRWLLTDKNKYWLPLDVEFGKWVKPGAVLAKYTPLARLLDVYSYDNDPDWIFDPDSGAAGYLEGVITTQSYTSVAGSNPFFMFATDTPHQPRFDICRQLECRQISKSGSGSSRVRADEGDPMRHFQTLEEGLWHNLVGRNIVYIVFRDPELYEKYGDVIYDLLLEIVPIHVHCIVDYELEGWFFYDPELTDETGIAWFTDEDFRLIEDPESVTIYDELSIYHPAPHGEENIYSYGDTVAVIGKAPVGSTVRLTITDSSGVEHTPESLDPETLPNPFEITGDGLFEFDFKVIEAFSPRDAVLKLSVEPGSTEEQNSPSVQVPVRVIEHTLDACPLDQAYAWHGYPYALEGSTDAPDGSPVTLSWPRQPDDPESPVVTATAYASGNLFSYTSDAFPVGEYTVTVTVRNGTRRSASEGEGRFIDIPEEVEIKVLPSSIEYDRATMYEGGGLRNDFAVDYGVQEPVFPVLTITSPTALSEIILGSVVAIAGTTDFADGSTVTIKSVVSGTETTIGTATVASGAFSYEWMAAGEAGAMTIKAVCGNISASVDITLAAAAGLSIESEVSADTPSGYIHSAGNTSITSTVSADTPSNI